jgi:hypothetical protein
MALFFHHSNPMKDHESVQLWARNIRQHSWLRGSTFTVLTNEGSGKWEAVWPEIHGQAVWQVTEISQKSQSLSSFLANEIDFS